MVQYVEPSVTSKVWPGCSVTDLPFWLSPAWMLLEGEGDPCHGNAQLARHTMHMMQTIPYVAPTPTRRQNALADTSLFIALISPSLRRQRAL
jgi:hypothetical protein